MLVKDNAGVTTGTIVGPDGEVLSIPTRLFSADEAALLRQYKKLLQKYGLREALYCNECFTGNLSDGMDAHVRDTDILFKCRHRLLYYRGQTF